MYPVWDLLKEGRFLCEDLLLRILDNLQPHLYFRKKKALQVILTWRRANAFNVKQLVFTLIKSQCASTSYSTHNFWYYNDQFKELKDIVDEGIAQCFVLLRDSECQLLASRTELQKTGLFAPDIAVRISDFMCSTLDGFDRSPSRP